MRTRKRGEGRGGERVCEEKEGFSKNINGKWEEERDGENEDERDRKRERTNKIKGKLE